MVEPFRSGDVTFREITPASPVLLTMTNAFPFQASLLFATYEPEFQVCIVHA